MAEICCGVVSENEASSSSSSCETRTARRRRMEIRHFKFVGDSDDDQKRQKLELYNCKNAVGSCSSFDERESGKSEMKKTAISSQRLIVLTPNSNPSLLTAVVNFEVHPKYGMASVCGRRRDMEDAVAIHPSFCRREDKISTGFHYFGVYDGHGCSHVATNCRDRLHELVKEELQNREASTEWKSAMEISFSRMDKEVIARNESVTGAASCRCELQTPECDAVGSTAVVAVVTPDKIIVANCGDSRAVMCRDGQAFPLSTDHKPDRPDELSRIEAAGGRVLYWEGARVLGVLAMSRAIGDNYLKPYVSSEPEVTVTDRTADDDCLILASDGLWDVVSNETACGVARMCLRGNSPETETCLPERNSDKACSDASMLLTKLALARRSSDNVSVVVINLKRDT